MNATVKFILLLLLLSGAANGLKAAMPKGGTQGGTGGTNGTNGVLLVNSGAGCKPTTASALLEINNVRALIKNGGDMWFNTSTSVPTYEVPKTTDPTEPKRNSMFAGGIWIGGYDRADQTKTLVQAQTYRQNGQITFWAGPIDSVVATTNAARCKAYDNIFEARKSIVRQYVTDYNAGLIRTDRDIPNAIKYWPGRNSLYLPDKAGFSGIELDFTLAAFVDKDGDGVYNPLNGDYPRLRGDKFLLDAAHLNPARQMSYLESGADQMLWYVTNDVGNTKNFGGGASGDAIGLEIQTEAFAYATADATNNMTFYRQIIVNKGTKYIDKCWFGQFADPDLGYSGDDYVECNVPRGLGICYNGEDVDPGVTGYGANPPSIGVDYFIGPKADNFDGLDNNKNGVIDEDGEKIIMSNFMYYNNAAGTFGDPNNRDGFYYLLQSKWAGNGKYATYDYAAGHTVEGQSVAGQPGLIAQPYKFIFPGTSDLSICYGLDGANNATVQYVNRGGVISRRDTAANPCPGGSPSKPNQTVLKRWDETSAHNTPGDRRFLGSAGPFTLVPGAMNQLTVGVVWARASSGGARGSFEALLTADDMAQRLFDRDFELIAGPPKPQLAITELDGSLILSWPDASNTIENYSVLDAGLNPDSGDTYYRFQGYIIYQVVNDLVSSAELTDDNKSRVVAQCDLKDDVSKVTNQVFSSDANAEVDRLMVSGENKGLFHSIQITKDQFNTQYDKLLNNKKYYFIIVAYATNFNRDKNSTQHFLLNRLGDGEALVNTGTPHLSAPERGGSVILSKYGDLLNFTRIKGYGTGGLTLDSLTGSSEAAILKTNSQQEMGYVRGHGPVEIKVYNPKRIKRGLFNLELSSRVTFVKANTKGNQNALPAVGDTIVANFSLVPYSGVEDAVATLYRGQQQKQGRAIVQRVITADGGDSVNLDIHMLNDDSGGTFLPIYEVKSKKKCGNGDLYSFVSYNPVPTTFTKFHGDGSVVYTTNSFQLYDYWRIFDVNKPSFVVYATHRASEAQEELIPSLGISVRLNNVYSPGTRTQENRHNAFRSFSIDHKDPGKFWLYAIGNGSWPTLPSFGPGSKWVKGANTGDCQAYQYPNHFDVAGVYYNMTFDFGTFGSDTGLAAPYYACNSTKPAGSTNPGPAYFGSATSDQEKTVGGSLNAYQLQNLHNVDIVFTADKKLWTRCVVLQYDPDTHVVNSIPGIDLGALGLLKSRMPSVDKNGDPTNERSVYTAGGVTYDSASTGLGWFPGYAIDLDRGLRLNMLFCESMLRDTIHYNRNGKRYQRGNDCVYNFPKPPGSGVQTSAPIYNSWLTNSYVYVLGSQYDSAVSTQKFFDSTHSFIPFSQATTVLKQNVGFWFAKNVQWVTQPQVVGTNAFQTPARMKFRVDRSFVSYPGSGDNPIYQFSTNGLEASLNDRQVAEDALGLCRVVPNPYYGFSEYENDQLDHRVRITNLPSRCTIRIYTLSGTLVKTIQHDQSFNTSDNNMTSEDWNLQTDNNLPIASGVYLINIDAGSQGNKVLKWFGALRPTDLNGNTQ